MKISFFLFISLQLSETKLILRQKIESNLDKYFGSQEKKKKKHLEKQQLSNVLPRISNYSSSPIPVLETDLISQTDDQYIENINIWDVDSGCVCIGRMFTCLCVCMPVCVL